MGTYAWNTGPPKARQVRPYTGIWLRALSYSLSFWVFHLRVLYGNKKKNLSLSFMSYMIETIQQVSVPFMYHKFHFKNIKWGLPECWDLVVVCLQQAQVVKHHQELCNPDAGGILHCLHWQELNYHSQWNKPFPLHRTIPLSICTCMFWVEAAIHKSSDRHGSYQIWWYL